MEDEALVPLDCKGLANLRVVDLKQELEKRGLSKSGSKKDLVKRLKQQLEFEKLCKERKSSGDYDLKLELDADIEKNEFVQQYLAQQQKRKEEKRLQEEIQKQNEGKSRESSEEQVTEDENPVSESAVTNEDENDENECQIEKPTNLHEDAKNDTVCDTDVKVLAKEEDTSSAFNTIEHVDKTKPASPADISENIPIEGRENLPLPSSDHAETENDNKNGIHSVDAEKVDISSSEDVSGVKESKVIHSADLSLPSADLEIKESPSYPSAVPETECCAIVIKVSEDPRGQQNLENINDAYNSDKNIIFRECHETFTKGSENSGEQENIDTNNSHENNVFIECHETERKVTKECGQQKNKENFVFVDNSDKNITFTECPESVTKVSEDSGEQRDADGTNSNKNIIFTECCEPVVKVLKHSEEEQENNNDNNAPDINIVVTESHKALTKVSEDSRKHKNQETIDDANKKDINVECQDINVECPKSSVEVSEDSGEQENLESIYDTNRKNANIEIAECLESAIKVSEDSREQENLENIGDNNKADVNVEFAAECPESAIKVSKGPKMEENINDANNADTNTVLTECHKTEIEVPDDSGDQKYIDGTNNLDAAIPLKECLENVSKVTQNSTQQENMENIYNSTKNSNTNIVLPETMPKIEDDECSRRILGDVQSSDVSESMESIEHPVDIIDISEKNKQLLPLNATSSEKSSIVESSCGQAIISTMESAQCTSVPYSLSDIQLPESPGNHPTSSNCGKSEGNSSKSNSVSKDEAEKNSDQDSKAQPNGISVSEAVDSNHDEVSSEPETKESKNESSPEKSHNEKKESDDNRQCERSEKSEASDSESDRNERHDEKRKPPKYEDTSSNVAADSEEQSKDSTYKRQKSKSPHQSAESDNSKSSDSDKHSHRDSKHKSREKRRKRSRRSHSQSSSSSSHSSDSSPKRRHSKKSVVTKSKNYTENDESNQRSTKSSNEKPANHKNDSKSEEQVSVPSSTKKRLKIKRDNVSVEMNSSNIETEDKIASKSVEKTASDSHTEKSPSKPSKPEPTEPKEFSSEISYVPRKLSLSHRKLSRKSSEDSEQKTKKGKWESFATSQKTSQTISISTDSLKNWFPDFKLMSEPTTPMELEPDEHSLPVGEEKSTDPSHVDASEGNDTAVKHGSTSQMEVEEGEAEESNIDGTAEQGPVSKIIFIQNLVRPFTLNQLKDLLKQSGKIVEEYFWIDKIKSKCFVMYETEREAVKARNALNNTRWPPSNPKILSVEFSNEEELEQHKRGNDVPPKPAPAVESHETGEHRAHQSPEEHKRKDRDRRKDRERSKPQPPVREWDKDKIMQESPEREHASKEEKSRSTEKKDKKETKKRPNEDTPAKLLDDLFQKTKSPPCIYWLPLTEEQAKAKEEAKKLRKLEREKRNQQKEQEEAERRNKAGRSSRRSREKENRKSSTRSRSPVSRRR